MTRGDKSGRAETRMKPSKGKNSAVKVNAAVGRVIAGARVRSLLTQHEVATLTGIDYRVLSRMENGFRPLRVAELQCFANVYGTTDVDLMNEIMTQLGGSPTTASVDRLITRSRKDE